MILEELKYALINLNCSDELTLKPFLEHFYMKEGVLIAKVRNVILEGTENEIVVLFDNNSYLYPERLEFLNKENTIKTFQNHYSAIEYLKYLVRATKDVRFEMFHYFQYKLKEIGFEYESWGFCYTNNESLEKLIVNFSLGNIIKNGNKMNFSIHIRFFKNKTCILTYHPEKPLWDEGKICPERQLDKILNFVKKLNVIHYDDIPLNEVLLNSTL